MSKSTTYTRDEQGATFSTTTAVSNKATATIATDSIGFDREAQGTGTRSRDSIDITRAIKEEVLAKQATIMREWYTAQVENEEEKKKILNYRNAELREHAKNPDLIDKAGKDKALHAKLNQAEVQGYRNVNQRFQNELSNLEWDKDSVPDSRVKEIKNANGQVIANLAEQTVKGPLDFPTIDGGAVRVENYRSINFPSKLLGEGQGPMHLQMAVKDAQGNNIAADKAVYFTAHYDKQGNLESFSHPTPVKFAGEGKDAIAYIEREGQIYTLPVTREKLTELQKQLDINKGRSIDIGVAQDYVSTEAPQRPQTQAPAVNPRASTDDQSVIVAQKPEITRQTEVRTPKPLPDPVAYSAAKKIRDSSATNVTQKTEATQQSTGTFVKGVLSPEQRQYYRDQDKLKEDAKTSKTIGVKSTPIQAGTQAPKSQLDIPSKDVKPTTVEPVVDPIAQANKLRSGLTRANSVPDLTKARKQDVQEASKTAPSSGLDKPAEQSKSTLQRRNSTGSIGPKPSGWGK
jgi:hypothetical protein